MQDLGNAATFDKYILPYIKATTEDMASGSLADSGHPYYRLSGEIENNYYLNDASEIVTLLNGVQLIIPKNIGKNSYITIYLDLDGYKNGKNRFGRDTFVLGISPKLYSYISYTDDHESVDTLTKTREELKNGPSYNRYNCNKSGRGMWCGALIQKDNWQIRDDYPW